MTQPYEVPAYFAQFITSYFGERGAAWLLKLPDLLAHYAREWELELLSPVSGLSFNYVAPVVRADGSPAVLKVGVPEEEARTGILFLRLCKGTGAVRLLHFHYGRPERSLAACKPAHQFCRGGKVPAGTHPPGSSRARSSVRPSPLSGRSPR